MYNDATKTIPIMIRNSHERMNLPPYVAQTTFDPHLHHPSILPCLLDPEDLKYIREEIRDSILVEVFTTCLTVPPGRRWELHSGTPCSSF